MIEHNEKKWSKMKMITMNILWMRPRKAEDESVELSAVKRR